MKNIHRNTEIRISFLYAYEDTDKVKSFINHILHEHNQSEISTR